MSYPDDDLIGRMVAVQSVLLASLEEAGKALRVLSEKVGATAPTPPPAPPVPSAVTMVHPSWPEPGVAWIQTHCGAVFDVAHPTPDMVHFYDIAYALTHINRYTGHVGPYSVAQHSILLAEYCLARFAEKPYVKQMAALALLHDAHEAYTGDATRPVQKLLPAWKMICTRVQAVIETKFRVAPAHYVRDMVDMLDTRIILDERERWMLPCAKRWDVGNNQKLGVEILRASPEAVIERFRRLALKTGVVTSYEATGPQWVLPSRGG